MLLQCRWTTGHMVTLIISKCHSKYSVRIGECGVIGGLMHHIDSNECYACQTYGQSGQHDQSRNFPLQKIAPGKYYVNSMHSLIVFKTVQSTLICTECDTRVQKWCELIEIVRELMKRSMRRGIALPPFCGIVTLDRRDPYLTPLHCRWHHMP